MISRRDNTVFSAWYAVCILLAFLASGLKALPWHCQGAGLCFTLEADNTRSAIPAVSLADIKVVHPDSVGNFAFGPMPGEARYKYLDGRLHSFFMTVKGSGSAVFRTNGRYQRFTAKAGFSDNTDNSARVRFEIWSDDTMLFQSPVIDKNSRPVEINVAVPLETRKIKLLSLLTGNIGGGEVIWADPGFMEIGNIAQSSLAELYIPQNFGPASTVRVFDDTGTEIAAQLLSDQRQNPAKIIFDSSSGSKNYYAYLLTATSQQGQATEPAKPWNKPMALSLETRILARERDRVYTHPGFIEAWNTDAVKVDYRWVDAIHHSFPPALLSRGNELIGRMDNCFGLYTYTGWFNIRQAGEYDFATASNWGSTIFIDDKFVVHWPEKHEFNQGRRCEYSQKVYLEPGIHKLEYMNYNQWGRQFTMCAWRITDGVYRIMTAADFITPGYFTATALRTAQEQFASSFTWQVTDDLRIDTASDALVAVKFSALPAVTADSELDLRWDFGDGMIGQGRTVEHVYLAKGQYDVTLTAAKTGTDTATVTQRINVDIDTGKLLVEARDPGLFDNAVDAVFLEHVNIASLKGLYRYARQAQNDTWQRLAADIICGRKPESLELAADMGFYCELAQYLTSLPVGRYDQALALLGELAKADTTDKSRLADARLLYIRQLIDYAGAYDQATSQLELLKGSLSLAQTTRRELLRAEIAAGCGQLADGTEYFSMPAGSLADQTRRQLEQAVLLRKARQAAASTDKESLQNAYIELMQLLEQMPTLVFDPEFNLARLAIFNSAAADIQLANIAGRCTTMPRADNIMPQLLYYRAVAFSRLNKPEQASELLRQLQQEYPYCPETANLQKELKP